ncbi:hypothetical protein TNCV_3467591 [Trichonephila clavipes]|nr:hypothetical protein TNCV_3467591 [Trichonephila clavipes]
MIIYHIYFENRALCVYVEPLHETAARRNGLLKLEKATGMKSNPTREYRHLTRRLSPDLPYQKIGKISASKTNKTLPISHILAQKPALKYVYSLSTSIYQEIRHVFQKYGVHLAIKKIPPSECGIKFIIEYKILHFAVVFLGSWLLQV